MSGCAQLDFYKKRFDYLFKQYFQTHYQHLESAYYQQLTYALETPAKRLRPLIIYASVLGFGGALEWADALAMAVESAHTYSLIHDDLPCMDDDSFRRGWPTVHERYSEGVALLIGDAFLTEAFGLIGEYRGADSLKIRALQDFFRVMRADQLLYGQWRDLYGTVLDLDGLYSLHAQKTGALFSFCFAAGAYLGQNIQKTTLHRIGREIGVVFQLQDDLIDFHQDAKKHFHFLIQNNYVAIKKLIEETYARALQDMRELLPNSQWMCCLVENLAQRHL